MVSLVQLGEVLMEAVGVAGDVDDVIVVLHEV